MTTEDAEFEYMEDAVLHCNVTDSTRTYTYTWKKGEKSVDNIQVAEKQKYVQHENGTLEMTRPCK